MKNTINENVCNLLDAAAAATKGKFMGRQINRLAQYAHDVFMLNASVAIIQSTDDLHQSQMAVARMKTRMERMN